jgi:hypothetical protein
MGIGGGQSVEHLSGVNIQSGNIGLTGRAGDLMFAHQFLGRIRTYLGKRAFLFGEYKYYAANWLSGLYSNPCYSYRQGTETAESYLRENSILANIGTIATG